MQSVQPLVAAGEEAIAIVNRHGLADTQVAQRQLDHAKDRLGFSKAHTVIALAGTTGSGKSSLLNALIGHDLSATGVKRPTTGEPMAVIFGGLAEATPLLNALGVNQRHYAEAPPSELEGLVLIDLPDFDSFDQSNRAHAQRLIGRVDAIIWVTDPQKYADASLHQDFLAPMRHHAQVLDVVLNQADRLDRDQCDQILADLGRRLEADGLGELTPMAVSALTGQGVPALRLRLAQRVTARQAMVQRVCADMVQILDALPHGDSPGQPFDQGVLREAIIPELAAALGADAIHTAIAAQTRRQVFLAAGWPPLRWLQRWRPNPVASVASPGVSPLAEAHVAKALRTVAAKANQTLGSLWAQPVAKVIDQAREPILIGLDQAASRSLSLPERLPSWVRVLGLLQTLGILSVLIGVLWLTALRLLGAFLLVDPSVLREAALPIGALPTPSWLVVVGLVMGLVVSLIVALAGRRLASRRADQVRRDLVRGLDQPMARHLFDPLEVIARDGATLEHLRTRRP